MLPSRQAPLDAKSVQAVEAWVAQGNRPRVSGVVKAP